MKDSTFTYIWDEVIKNAVDDIASEFVKPEYEIYNFKINNLNRMKNVIHKDYEENKRFLKQNYYMNKKANNSKNRIDNHKIAACICFSLLNHKIFSFDVLEDMPLNLFVSNYELAYTVSLGFIYTTLLAQYHRIGKSEYAEKLTEQGTIVVPGTSRGHDEYHTGRIHTLALNDIFGNTFDLLTYSDMMFWIEYYNRQIIEDTLSPMDLWDE